MAVLDASRFSHWAPRVATPAPSLACPQHGVAVARMRKAEALNATLVKAIERVSDVHASTYVHRPHTAGCQRGLAHTLGALPAAARLRDLETGSVQNVQLQRKLASEAVAAMNRDNELVYHEAVPDAVRLHGPAGTWPRTLLTCETGPRAAGWKSASRRIPCRSKAWHWQSPRPSQTSTRVQEEVRVRAIQLETRWGVRLTRTRVRQQAPRPRSAR